MDFDWPSVFHHSRSWKKIALKIDPNDIVQHPLCCNSCGADSAIHLSFFSYIHCLATKKKEAAWIKISKYLRAL